MEDKKDGQQENRESFKEWMNGALELVKPWKLALILTNLFWALVLFCFIWFAYMTPETTYQSQDFTSQVQTQSDGTQLPAEAQGGK